ncbi:MAG TPA: cytochrome c biogenesis protein CcsA, partial [Candidatus Methylacidiphilales bacterium]
MEDRLWFAVGTGLTLVSAGWAIFALGAGRSQHTQWNNGLLFVAWLAMSLFLSERGRAIGHCPITNLFETVAFLDWSLLLTYLVIGTAYRVSVLGAFTAPVVAATGFFALVAPIDVPRLLPNLGWALEAHASFSLLAYGSLGLGAVASLLYLVQERQLKGHQLKRWFYRLPAMGDLARIQRRVLVWGFGLLTLGLAAGVFVP